MLLMSNAPRGRQKRLVDRDRRDCSVSGRGDGELRAGDEVSDRVHAFDVRLLEIVNEETRCLFDRRDAELLGEITRSLGADREEKRVDVDALAGREHGGANDAVAADQLEDLLVFDRHFLREKFARLFLRELARVTIEKHGQMIAPLQKLQRETDDLLSPA